MAIFENYAELVEFLREAGKLNYEMDPERINWAIGKQN